MFPGILVRTPNMRVSHEILDPGVESFFVTTSDGKKIEVWHLASAAPGPARTAILFHDHAENLAQFFVVQRWVAKLGYSTYAFDYRGFGRSSGWPSEKGLYLDAEAVWDVAMKRDSAVPERVLIMGHSIGTGPAAYLAAAHQVKTLVLLSPYLSIPALVRGIPYLRYFEPLLWYRFPVRDYVSRLKKTCLVIAHGERDTTIPISHSRELATTQQDRLAVHTVFAAQSGHNELIAVAKWGVVAAIKKCEEAP